MFKKFLQEDVGDAERCPRFALRLVERFIELVRGEGDAPHLAVRVLGDRLVRAQIERDDERPRAVGRR